MRAELTFTIEKGSKKIIMNEEEAMGLYISLDEALSQRREKQRIALRDIVGLLDRVFEKTIAETNANNEASEEDPGEDNV